MGPVPTLVKPRVDAPPGFFEAEAAGIGWLAEAGGTAVADVVAVSPGRIELERIAHAPPTALAAYECVRHLAHTHAPVAAGNLIHAEWRVVRDACDAVASGRSQ